MNSFMFADFYTRAKGYMDFVTDKDKAVSVTKGYMFNRLQRMFRYDGLPDTIPHEILEYYLMYNGSCIIAKDPNKDRHFAFIGSFGGEPDVYYRPTLYVVANPAQKFSKQFRIWDLDGLPTDECVFMRNDCFWMGLNPLVSKYAYLLSENVITIRTVDIMLRAVALLSAPDDKTKAAGEEYLRKLEQGELGVMAENRFFDGIKMQSPPSNNGSYLTQFIELNQYLLGSFYNEIGLSANYNMKREAINSMEAKMDEDILTPLIDTMLEVRKDDVERLNEVYGWDVKVEFDSSWYENVVERKLILMNLESQAQQSLAGNSLEGGNKVLEDDVEVIEEDEVSQLTDIEGGEENVGISSEVEQSGDSVKSDLYSDTGDRGQEREDESDATGDDSVDEDDDDFESNADTSDNLKSQDKGGDEDGEEREKEKD